MTILYRRHLASCKHARKGGNFSGCACPIWIDRILDGKRRLESCKTTRWEKAERMKLAYESGETDKPEKALRDAIAA